MTQIISGVRERERERDRGKKGKHRLRGECGSEILKLRGEVACF